MLPNTEYIYPSVVIPKIVLIENNDILQKSIGRNMSEKELKTFSLCFL